MANHLANCNPGASMNCNPHNTFSNQNVAPMNSNLPNLANSVAAANLSK